MRTRPQQGYLSEPELLHMHAIRCVLLGTPARETLDHLKPALRGIYKRVQREVERSTAELEALRQERPGMIRPVWATAD